MPMPRGYRASVGGTCAARSTRQGRCVPLSRRSGVHRADGTSSRSWRSPRSSRRCSPWAKRISPAQDPERGAQRPDRSLSVLASAGRHAPGRVAAALRGGIRPSEVGSLLAQVPTWPAVLAGLVTGAGVQTLVPRGWLLRVFNGADPASSGPLAGAGRAVAAALPMMLCTCCSAPVTVGLRRSRVAVRPALAYSLGDPAAQPGGARVRRACAVAALDALAAGRRGPGPGPRRVLAPRTHEPVRWPPAGERCSAPWSPRPLRSPAPSCLRPSAGVPPARLPPRRVQGRPVPPGPRPGLVGTRRRHRPGSGGHPAGRPHRR